MGRRGSWSNPRSHWSGFRPCPELPTCKRWVGSLFWSDGPTNRWIFPKRPRASKSAINPSDRRPRDRGLAIKKSLKRYVSFRAAYYMYVHTVLKYEVSNLHPAFLRTGMTFLEIVVISVRICMGRLYLQVKTGAKEREHILDSLVPFTTYKVFVVAVNEAGKSPKSPIERTTTLRKFGTCSYRELVALPVINYSLLAITHFHTDWVKFLVFPLVFQKLGFLKFLILAGFVYLAIGLGHGWVFMNLALIHPMWIVRCVVSMQCRAGLVEVNGRLVCLKNEIDTSSQLAPILTYLGCLKTTGVDNLFVQAISMWIMEKASLLYNRRALAKAHRALALRVCPTLSLGECATMVLVSVTCWNLWSPLAL